MKVSLFDVSDVNDLKVKSEVILGDSGSDSEVIRDHKAFLFNKEDELLVIPSIIYEKERQVDSTLLFNTIIEMFSEEGVELLEKEIIEDTRLKFIVTGNISFDEAEQKKEEILKLDGVVNVFNEIRITDHYFFTVDLDNQNISKFSNSGFTVMKINESGISVRDEIIFSENENYAFNINKPRSFFVNDVLFTLKNGKIKINNLEDLSEISEIIL